MFYHYIKTVFRNLEKQKLNSAINILGLSLGLAIALLIGIFVIHQLSYDKFIEDHERIYRIHSSAELGQGEPQTLPSAMFPVAEIAEKDLPEVEGFVRMTSYYSSPEIIIDDEVTTLSGIIFADSTFFSMFNFELLAGNPSTVLNQPNAIVLTKTSAQRWFADPLAAVNRMISIQGETYQITGVMQDLPANTHMAFNAVSNHESLPDQIKVSGMNFYTYLKLTPGTDVQALESKLDDIVDEHIQTNPLYEGLRFTVVNELMKLGDIHLHSNLIWEMKDNGSFRNVVIFGLLGVFVLFLAIINYVNLATARSTLRSKEIGMRKVAGASRGGLIRQIIIESMVITLISFMLAFAITEVFTGFFTQNLGVDFKTSVLMSPSGILVILSVLLLTGFLSGLYPAFYMAAFDPVKILKGEVVKGSRGKRLRQSLVVFQFAITIFIISSLFVIINQLRYMQKHDLGFEQEQVLLVRNVSSGIWRSTQEVNAELESLARVRKAAGANFIYGGSNRVDLISEQGAAKESGVTADILTVDANFLEVMGIELTEGRNFHPGSEADAESAFILNQTAVNALGFKNPVNKQLDLFTRQGPLVGVVRDFHLKSLHQPIEPLVMIYAQTGFPHIYMRVTPGDYRQLQEDIAGVLNSFDPAYVPDIIFLDERIQNLYQQEQNSSTLLSSGALLAIIISILGVYGLASFSAERRVKEIGIRKVLGASLPGLLWVFNKESVILVGVSFVLAAPLAWVAMEGWQNNFAVQAPLNLLWFILPGIITLVLSSATISLQAWLTARANPVKSLRSE